MAQFSAREYTDMVITYGMAGENGNAAVRLYAERFSDRVHPSCVTLTRCIQRLRETGSVVPNRVRPGAVMRHDVRTEERILREFERNPRNSVRRVAGALGISNSLVHRTLRRSGLRSYHYQRVQQLLPGDAQPRIFFCEGFLAQCRRNISFPDRILWTDEATFTPNGVFNSHNFVRWEEENPHAVRQGAFQRRWAINVWAGMIGDQVIGPYFLPPRLTGQLYAELLANQLPALLEDVPLDVRAELIFQHDGAPAHFSRQVRNLLDARFPDRWMGRGGPIIWPVRSPDLNVLDYFVWGYIKPAIEDRRDGTEQEVREAIVAAFDTITPDMAHRATRNITRRAEICVREGGRHFEQFLY
ncbi:hypothetical protein DMN91_001854 [Ooceraea biroi]|uniref:DUF4817 domain-containing protein n=1 Tax=Ooceraea biroi TaxID=2015173 RepID=A0A3L8DZ31_OOCBI|nr:hypothetical protein DMN91_001854 [Ooceraea biroi]